MSLIQEFIDQQINKHPSSIVIEQLQTCHSAVQELLLNMQSIKEMPKLQLIDEKLTKLSLFLQAKQKVLNIIQKSQTQSLSSWLIKQKITSSIVVQIVRKQQVYVDQMINKLIKKIFLANETFQEHLQQIQIVNHCVEILNTIKEDLKNNKNPNREKIKLIDTKDRQILERIIFFEQKVQTFNQEVNALIEQLYSFQSIIIKQFKSYFMQAVQVKNPTIYTEQPVYQSFEPLQTLPYGSNMMNMHGSKMAKTMQGGSGFGNQASSFENQARSYFPAQTSQNWRAPRHHNKNQISNLGLQSQISINNNLVKDQAKRDSKLLKLGDGNARSIFPAR